MNKEYRNITPEEVFDIFKEEHRLCSSFDPKADPTVILTMNTSVAEWRQSMDLLEWKKLGQLLNEKFEIHISKEEWQGAFSPGKEKTIQNVCELISQHAKMEVVKPVKLFGNQCLSASLFRMIKRNLSKRGVDTTDLTPSSKIEPYLKSNCGVFIEQINKNFTGVIPEIIMKKTRLEKLNRYLWLLFIISLITFFTWNFMWYIPVIIFVVAMTIQYISSKEFILKEGMMMISEIETFRDLIERIIKEKYATQ